MISMVSAVMPIIRAISRMNSTPTLGGAALSAAGPDVAGLEMAGLEMAGFRSGPARFGAP